MTIELQVTGAVRLLRREGATDWIGVDQDGHEVALTDEQLQAASELELDHMSLSAIIELAIAKSGTKWWLHATDRPALVYANGAQEWYLAELGQHRGGGEPAVVDEEFSVYEWYVGGQSHREGGPSSIVADTLDWCYKGVDFTAKVDAVLEELRAGGLILRVDHVSPDGDAICSIVDVAGDVVGSAQLRSKGWVDWIIANASVYFPELAAAMRARGMHHRIAESSAAAPGSSAEVPQSRRRPGPQV